MDLRRDPSFVNPALTEAPAVQSSRTTSAWQLTAADVSGVRPSADRAFGSAPLLSRYATTLHLPFADAEISGVWPVPSHPASREFCELGPAGSSTSLPFASTSHLTPLRLPADAAA